MMILHHPLRKLTRVRVSSPRAGRPAGARHHPLGRRLRRHGLRAAGTYVYLPMRLLAHARYCLRSA
eukprot:3045276-Rhodomonas_salina.3